MDNVSFFDLTNRDGIVVSYATITNPDGSFTSMLKSTYDAQQAAQVAQTTLASELSNPSTPQAGE